MKAVFDSKAESAYDDDLAHRYHFPSRYLDVASRTVGDWVVFRQPRASGGSKAYFAVGRVTAVVDDPASSGHFYALITDYLQFDRPVPWLAEGRYFEDALRRIENVPQLGLYLRGRSLRPLQEADFVAIVSNGLRTTLDPANAIRLGLDPTDVSSAGQPGLTPDEPFAARRVERILVNRKVRDASFRQRVCAAYEDRCAVTGLRIVNGGGRSEVQAAHIWPVGDGGPDTVQNGLALSATVHWLFDRHLISLTDDYALLISHNRVPSELLPLIGERRDRIRLPSDPGSWPRRGYLARHREAFAGG